MTYQKQRELFFLECMLVSKYSGMLILCVPTFYYAYLAKPFSSAALIVSVTIFSITLAEYWRKKTYVHMGSPFSRELKFKQLPSPSEFIPYPHKRLKTPHKMLTAEELAAFRERVGKYPDALKDVDVNNITHAVALNVELVIHQYYKRKLAERHAEQSLMEEITKLNNLLEESSKDG